MKKGQRKQFCIHGHDTFVTGRYESNGACIECNLSYGPIYYENNKKEHQENVKVYRDNHKEQFEIYQKQYKLENKEKIRIYLKNYNLIHTYNITLEDYNKLLIKQEYRCAGCLKHQNEFKSALAIDHDHKCCPGKKSCGKCIRGLLCDSCNNVLGRSKDNAEVLIRLANYLKNLSKYKF